MIKVELTFKIQFIVNVCELLSDCHKILKLRRQRYYTVQDKQTQKFMEVFILCLLRFTNLTLQTVLTVKLKTYQVVLDCRKAANYLYPNLTIHVRQ